MSAPRRAPALLFGAIALAGLALYLWPALRAPITQWSDSAIDMELARRGAGLRPPTAEEVALAGKHPIKPLWILFLRGAGNAIPGMPEERSVVVVQSLLLWASFVATAGLVYRRRSAAAGVALLAVLLLFLRFRDSASVVLSEALAMAILLTAVAVSLLLPPSPKLAAILGVTSGILFGIRPNVGAALLLLAALAAIVPWRPRELLLLAGAFLLVVLPVFLLTRSEAEHAARGLDWPVLYASAEDFWEPSLRLDAAAEAEAPRERLRRTLRNWQETLDAANPDRGRQLLWRSLHGLFGVENADERWSPSYGAADRAARTLSPFLVLAATALLLTFPFRGEEKSANAAAALLLAGVVGQSLLLGSLPRYVLPFLPVLFLLALLAAGAAVRRRLGAPAAALVAAALAWLLATHPGLLGQEWGRVEEAGVTIRQEIRKGVLPPRGPATLHVRIASPLPQHGSDLEVWWGDRRLYDSREDSRRDRPSISLALPQELLDQNAREATVLSLRAAGTYGPHQYLLFPVVPRPWGAPAVREGSAWLSPSTGVRSGALDWWAHAGPEPGS
ncbi:MAG TPA: hypothetical protein VIE39_04370 [Thermoanaerobaculia bacterium]